MHNYRVDTLVTTVCWRRQSSPPALPATPSCPRVYPCLHPCGTQLLTLFLNPRLCCAFKVTRVPSVSPLVTAPFGLFPFGVPLLREGGPVPCRLAWGAFLVWFSASLRPPLAVRRSWGRGLAGCGPEGGSARGWPRCVLGGTCWVPVPLPRCPMPALLLWSS